MTEVGALSELRQDILTGEWVIFAGNRKKRPYDFIKKSVPKTTGTEGLSVLPGKRAFHHGCRLSGRGKREMEHKGVPEQVPGAIGNVTDEDAGGDGFYTSFRGTVPRGNS